MLEKQTWLPNGFFQSAILMNVQKIGDIKFRLMFVAKVSTKHYKFKEILLPCKSLFPTIVLFFSIDAEILIIFLFSIFIVKLKNSYRIMCKIIYQHVLTFR